jgi:hypothetical protein
MERGLIWLPLLGLFFYLTYAGWNEYRKVEAYRIWAEDFDQAKYDIRAVLARKENQLVWGQPTRQGPINLQTLTLTPEVQFQLQIDEQTCDAATDPLPQGRAIALIITCPNASTQSIAFTEAALAQRWAHSLQRYCQSLTPSEGD